LTSTGKTEHLKQSLYTEVSARRLVDNLLTQRPGGPSVEAVNTEQV
jgi:hypothetical protein